MSANVRLSGSRQESVEISTAGPGTLVSASAAFARALGKSERTGRRYAQRLGLARLGKGYVCTPLILNVALAVLARQQREQSDSPSVPGRRQEGRSPRPATVPDCAGSERTPTPGGRGGATPVAIGSLPLSHQNEGGQIREEKRNGDKELGTSGGERGPSEGRDHGE